MDLKEFFKNFIINIKARGIAAIFAVLFLSIAAVGIWGTKEIGGQAISVLGSIGILVAIMAGMWGEK